MKPSTYWRPEHLNHGPSAEGKSLKLQPLDLRLWITEASKNRQHSCKVFLASNIPLDRRSRPIFH